MSGLRPHQHKLDKALRYTCDQLDLAPMHIHVRQWSNLEIGKGMGSDGTMYEGITVVNQKTGLALREWSWHPDFVIVMLVPGNSVLTGNIQFLGKEKLAPEYAELLEAFDAAIARRSVSDFAELSTRAAVLNAPYLLNPHAQILSKRLSELGALGLNVGHTGTVCGLLYPNTQTGHEQASEADFKMRRWFTDLSEVMVVTTPPCLASTE